MTAPTSLDLAADSDRRLMNPRYATSSKSKMSSLVGIPPQQLSRHLHEDEEIRYILSGSGFFDVRGTLSI
jgi:hypothetical protein